jgi:hypothetical protein
MYIVKMRYLWRLPVPNELRELDDSTFERPNVRKGSFAPALEAAALA